MSETEMNANPQPVKRNYQRRVRNIFIHKPMQREFTLVIIALLMVSSIAIGFVIHSTIREAAFGGGFHFGKINPYEVLSEVSYQLVLRVTSILFVTLIVIGAFGIFFLHRIAGPVYRFRQVISRLNNGQIPPHVKLREGDFFAEVALEINQLLENSAMERSKAERALEKINTILSSKPGEPIGGLAQEVKEILSK